MVGEACNTQWEFHLGARWLWDEEGGGIALWLSADLNNIGMSVWRTALVEEDEDCAVETRNHGLGEISDLIPRHGWDGSFG